MKLLISALTKFLMGLVIVGVLLLKHVKYRLIPFIR